MDLHKVVYVCFSVLTMAVVTLGSAKHFDVTQYSASPGGSFDSNKQVMN